MGEVDGQAEKELLRFDCFDQAPHYHYAPLGKNERRDMDKTTAGNPIGWTLRQLRTRLPAMLEHAGYGEVASKLDSELVAVEAGRGRSDGPRDGADPAAERDPQARRRGHRGRQHPLRAGVPRARDTIGAWRSTS